MGDFGKLMVAKGFKNLVTLVRTSEERFKEYEGVKDCMKESEMHPTYMCMMERKLLARKVGRCMNGC